jgi:multicomponent K+:H+ antiporter subunit F
MLSVALVLAATMLAVAVMLNVWVLFRGPDLPDRILALDTLYINAIALLVVYGISRSTASFFEAALLIAMLGFISTVALCKYLLRGDIIE